jgi:hypothetical protein
MKTRDAWAVILKLTGAAILVSSLLLLGILPGAGKRRQTIGEAQSPVTAGAATNQRGIKNDAKWIEAYGKLPLSFEENLGQTAQEVRFVSHGSRYALFLMPQEAVISLQRAMPRDLSPFHRMAYLRALRKAHKAGITTVLRMHLEGTNPAVQIAGIDRLPGNVNYFIGKDPKGWRTDVPTYAQVKYKGIYPGVDLVFYGNHGRLEYDFVVAPGADPKVIELNLKGARKVRINSNGDLVLGVPDGEVALQRPAIYQNVSGSRHEIQGRYVLAASHRVTFAVANYDRSAPLVIDPVLNYSTYLGGSAVGDIGSGIAVDSLGDAFVTGTTSSTIFPSTPGGFGAGNAIGVAFVTEINPTGTALLYTTYLGGTGGDFGFGIALDNSGSGANPGGNVYVTGNTFSTDFPTTAANALKSASAGAAVGTSFLSKINPTGSGLASLVYSTYLGGTDGIGANPDVGEGVAADVNGNAYVTGLTTSSPGAGDANFPVTAASAFQTTLGTTDGNAFLTRIDTTQVGSASLAYSTYLGGSGANATSSGLQFGELAQGVAVGASQNAYIVGITTSSDFPTTNANAFQPNTAPPAAVALGTIFVSRIDTSTTKAPAASLVYSTYWGGENQDLSSAIALKPNSTVAYVTGTTDSLLFPTFPSAAPGPYQKTGSTGGTAFLSLIDTGQVGNASLTYSTFLGGPRTTGFGIAVDASGNAYVGGGTSNSGYPVTPGAFQPSLAAGAQGDGFISKINPGGNGTSDLVYSSFFGGSGIVGGPDAVHGVAIDSQSNAYITGLTFSSSASFPVFPSGAFQTNLAGGDLSAAFVAKLTLIPTMAVSPTSLAFGTQPVGITSGAKTVTLTNNTSDAIPFPGSSIAFTGTNLADFASPSNTCGGSIAAGTSCNLSVTFTPSVASSETATLAITVTITNGGVANPQTFDVSLTGNGSNSAPGVGLAPTSLAFGNQVLNTTSAAKTVTLTNTGTGALTITSIAASGDFAETSNGATACPISPATLAAGANCIISVTFTPTALGARAGTVTITDNAGGSPHLVPLTGTGTGAPAVGLAPASLAFGNQAQNTTSAAKTVTLTNTGSAALTITLIAASGDFAETSTGATACPISPATLAAGANCIISVTFTPTALGARAGNLTITDNAGTGTQTVPLTGTGTGTPDFGLTGPAGVQGVTLGQTLNFSVTVTGTGGFNSPVALACTGAPALSNCTVTSPVTPPVAPPSTIQAQVSMTTTALVIPPQGIPTPTAPPQQVVPLVLALMMLFSLVWVRRPRLRLAMATAVLTLFAITGCNGLKHQQTPKGAATLTITGTSGALTHNVQVQISVN